MQRSKYRLILVETWWRLQNLQTRMQAHCLDRRCHQQKNNRLQIYSSCIFCVQEAVDSYHRGVHPSHLHFLSPSLSPPQFQHYLIIFPDPFKFHPPFIFCLDYICIFSPLLFPRFTAPTHLSTAQSAVPKCPDPKATDIPQEDEFRLIYEMD